MVRLSLVDRRIGMLVREISFMTSLVHRRSGLRLNVITFTAAPCLQENRNAILMFMRISITVGMLLQRRTCPSSHQSTKLHNHVH